jgi:hypothetical protein
VKDFAYCRLLALISLERTVTLTSTSNSMQSTRRRRKPVLAESLARLADQGKDVSRFFTEMMPSSGWASRISTTRRVEQPKLPRHGVTSHRAIKPRA